MINAVALISMWKSLRAAQRRGDPLFPVIARPRRGRGNPYSKRGFPRHQSADWSCPPSCQPLLAPVGRDKRDTSSIPPRFIRHRRRFGEIPGMTRYDRITCHCEASAHTGLGNPSAPCHCEASAHTGRGNPPSPVIASRRRRRGNPSARPSAQKHTRRVSPPGVSHLRRLNAITAWWASSTPGRTYR